MCFFYALQLENNSSFVEFETLDDVTIKNRKDIETKDTSFTSNIVNNEYSYRVIQVKKKKLNKSKTMDILLNWLLLIEKYDQIKHFILFTDKDYKNKNIVKEIKVKDLYLYACSDDSTSPKSIKNKIKTLYTGKGKYRNFIKNFKDIISKTLFIGDLEEKIKELGSSHFKKGAIPEEIYCARLCSALNDLTINIIRSTELKEPYRISQLELNKIEERIIQDTNEEMPIPLTYSEHKTLYPVDVNDYKETREYKQLNYCELPLTGIKRNLQYCCYYSDYKFRKLAINHHKQIENLETQSFENFEETKENLQQKNDDKPRNRLNESQKIRNDYTPRKELSHGAYIYLTQEEHIVGEKQISWKDEDE